MGATSIATTRSPKRFVVRRTRTKPPMQRAARTRSEGTPWRKAGDVEVVPAKRLVEAFPRRRANPIVGGRAALTVAATLP
jgi:hypothetical protein